MGFGSVPDCGRRNSIRHIRISEVLYTVLRSARVGGSGGAGGGAAPAPPPHLQTQCSHHEFHTLVSEGFKAIHVL